MKQMLGRKFNYATQCWEKPGVVSIPSEQMDEVMLPESSILDLMYLLVWRDRRANGVVKS